MDPRQVEVRPARAEDAATIAALQVDTWRVAYRGLMPDSVLDSLDVAARTDFWGSLFEESGAVRPGAIAPHVAEVGTRLIGYVAEGAATDADDQGQVFAIYVDAAWWGRGVGTALLDAACEALRAKGLRAALLWVPADNVGARRFYERRGWPTDGQQQLEDIGGVSMALVCYRCEL